MQPRNTFSCYENLQEVIKRIILCVNCPLANKPMDIEVPRVVLPNSVFEVVVQIYYDMQLKQVLTNGKRGALNVELFLFYLSGLN
ncbi:unnamed protein product, partial [Vitis vinifera]